jgi:hypothetical protein
MLERDRQLLADAAKVNARLGEAVLWLTDGQDGNGLPADRLEEIGRTLGQLGTQFLARAQEQRGRVVEAVIIDAHPRVTGQ